MFSVDALRCPRCATPMVVLALISAAPVVARILVHLGLPVEPLALSPARGRAALEVDELFIDLDRSVEVVVDAPGNDAVDDAGSWSEDDDEAPP